MHDSEIKFEFTDRVDYVTRTSVPLGFISATRHQKQLRPFTEFRVRYIPGILLSTSCT